MLICQGMRCRNGKSKGYTLWATEQIMFVTYSWVHAISEIYFYTTYSSCFNIFYCCSCGRMQPEISLVAYLCYFLCEQKIRITRSPL